MKESYIADDMLVLNLQNLRWVRKQDTKWTSSSTYDLVLCYNIKTEPILTVHYKEEKERNAIFDRVSKELTDKLNNN
jgi:hypothetical protein